MPDEGLALYVKKVHTCIKIPEFEYECLIESIGKNTKKKKKVWGGKDFTIGLL